MMKHWVEGIIRILGLTAWKMNYIKQYEWKQKESK